MCVQGILLNQHVNTICLIYIQKKKELHNDLEYIYDMNKGIKNPEAIIIKKVYIKP